jgi:hypothetical protein
MHTVELLVSNEGHPAKLHLHARTHRQPRRAPRIGRVEWINLLPLRATANGQLTACYSMPAQANATVWSQAHSDNFKGAMASWGPWRRA